MKKRRWKEVKLSQIDLKEEYRVQGGVLTCYACDMPFDEQTDGWKRPAVIVVGGGGYAMVCKRETEPIALRFFAKGFQVFVLEYTCAPQGAHYPEQLLQLACAVDYIKRNAETFFVNKDEVFLVGFSAGGHLAGNLSTDYTQATEAYGAALDCEVRGAGLCYPVVSFKHGHIGSFDNLFCGVSQAERAALTGKVLLDEIVCERTAPAFIWATATDSVVPVKNALRYAESLSAQGIAFELHVYPRGEHGLSTCDREINPDYPYLDKNGKWVDDCALFFRLFTKERY